MSVKELAGIPTDHLALLLEDLSIEENKIKSIKASLASACDLKFSERAKALRAAKGVDTGTVRFDDGASVVISDLAKRVKWDQPILRQIARTIADEWKEDVNEYLTVKLDVPESRFKAWPASIRAIFEPARTVETGSPVYKLELHEDREAA